MRTSESAKLEQVHGFKKLVDERRALIGRNAIELGVNQHVFAGGQFGIGRKGLGNHAENVANAVGVFDDVVPADARGAGSGRRERGHHANQRGLAGAIRSEQPEDFPARDD